MAKIDPKKEAEKSTNSGNAQLDAIMAEINALKEENKAMKSDMEKGKPKDPKKKYTGPRAYSFKKWGGMPVLSWKSFRKDPTMDFVDKNPITGKIVENQMLKLTVIDKDKKETEIDVLAVEFGKNHKMSDKIKCEVLKNGDKVTGYKFNDEHFGEFTVLPDFIN